MSEKLVVDPNGVCPYFDRVFWSLIEEPSTCDLCKYYTEDGSLCGCEARIVMTK